MKHILFGHQSVGQNLLEGIRDLAPAPAAKFSIAPFRVGRNHDPASKLEHFATVVRSEAAQGARLALFKFCYVDIDENTDVRALFDSYARTMDSLRREFPGLRFGHVTVPLRSVSSGLLTRLRHLAGRHHAQVRRNAARHRFNELLRRHVASESLFDIAAVEARGVDGEPRTTPGREGPLPVLAPEYTSDGGHLNDLGRRVVAREFLAFIERQPAA